MELPFPPFETTRPEVRRLVALGDDLFKEAMRRTYASDPDGNPGWKARNERALELFRRAEREGYQPAHDLYQRGEAIPRALQDRLRETATSILLCRSRAGP